ncbi:MAG: ABC transporter substrate-binding protein [Clostridiales bacterium]|nr:ABC transporter substrate-binding protein [Clostridiales bacterium]
MKEHRRTLALILALFLIVGLAGCSGGNSGNQQQASEGTTAPTDERTVSLTPDERASKDQIVIGIAQDLDGSLDPHQMATAGTREVLFNLYEGLVKPANDGNLIPAVASEYTVSDSADTFTFTLREGIRFHSGREVTVGDVVYSLSRAAGLNGGEALIPEFALVESVEAPDDRTVVVRIKQPNLEFLASLTAGIIPEGYDGAEGIPPEGTGPFMFVSRSPQENIIIRRFDGYWGDKPGMALIELKIVEKSETMLMSMRSGAIDFAAHVNWDWMQQLGDDFYAEDTYMNLVQALYLNNAVPPLDNMRVRQALCHGVNRQEIMDILADGKGYALGSSIYPAFGKYFIPELTGYYDYNPEKAMALLADAGLADGFDLEITVPSNYTPHVDAATVVVSQLETIGVRASIKQVEWMSWYTETYSNRQYVSTIVGVDAATMTARAMLERFVSDRHNNFINFVNEEYDRVFAEAIAETDEARQTALYKRLETILTEQAANVYIQDLCDYIAIRSGIGGYLPYPLYIIDMAALRYTR